MSDDLKFDPEAVKFLLSAILEAAEARVRPDDLDRMVSTVEEILEIVLASASDEDLNPKLRTQVERLVVLYREVVHLILVELKEPPKGQWH